MTDRVNALTVVLRTDMRDDDAQSTIAAILQLRAVLSVTPNVADVSDHVARQRVKFEVTNKLLGALE